MTWSSTLLQLTSTRVSAKKKIAVKHSFTMATTLHFCLPHSCFVLIGHFNSNHLCTLSHKLSPSFPPFLQVQVVLLPLLPLHPHHLLLHHSNSKILCISFGQCILCSGAVLNLVCVVKIVTLAYLYSIITLVT